jgi:hypothetical protein
MKAPRVDGRMSKSLFLLWPRLDPNLQHHIGPRFDLVIGIDHVNFAGHGLLTTKNVEPLFTIAAVTNCRGRATNLEIAQFNRRGFPTGVSKADRANALRKEGMPDILHVPTRSR